MGNIILLITHETKVNDPHLKLHSETGQSIHSITNRLISLRVSPDNADNMEFTPCKAEQPL